MATVDAGRNGTSHVKLFDLAELDDPGARGAEVEIAGRHHDFIVVLKDGALHGYVNRCPHKGTPLETFPHQFLDAQRQHLVCSTHGALFQLDDGYCVSGPCQGAFLKSVALEIRAGTIFVRADVLGAKA